MNFATTAILLSAASLGHFAITVWLFNRLHAIGGPRRLIKVLEKVLLAIAPIVLLLIVASAPWRGAAGLGSLFLSFYVAICFLAAVLIIPLWLVPKLMERTPAALMSNDTTVVDVAQRLEFRPLHGEARLLAYLPGNQLLQIAVQQKTIRLPNLSPSLDGLRIAHLSDLHMTGQLGREFYDLVVDETNSLAPDIVVITGDILEKEPCLPWIQLTLGRLKANSGKFFILGNHEHRLADATLLRSALAKAGFIHLGGKCQSLVVHSAEILLAGTELPWFGTAPMLPADDSAAFRILLSHSPDQLNWAKSNQFDLMLAGHTHGGQIRLPWLGALIAPSLYGTRYAGGLYVEPPTLLHVSRGLAGIHPLRFNCPPELALLILKR